MTEIEKMYMKEKEVAVKKAVKDTNERLKKEFDMENLKKAAAVLKTYDTTIDEVSDLFHFDKEMKRRLEEYIKNN